MSGELERLLEQATPGPWIVQKEPPWIGDTPVSHDDACLIALAPEMGRLLVDAMAHLSCLETPETTWSWSMTEVRALLARFAALEEKA